MSEPSGPDWGWEGDDPRTTQAADLSDLHQLELARAQVEVLSGPDAGARSELGPAGMVIGSGKACDLRLSDKQVSRRHVELRPETRGVRVTDLGSLNGSYLGAARIDSALLLADAVLALGSATLAVRIAPEPMRLLLSPRRQFGRAVGASESMRHVFALLEQAAQSDVTVLLEGDSGTGKDVLAVSLHEESARADGPLVVVDCAALPENLVESELFGHERGAFTGAVNARAGAFEQAHGGTLFLDEVGELPVTAQPKLLRALENRSFRRVGGGKSIDVDVRVVAATNRGLAEEVRAGNFRQDLYYRLSVVKVRVPPLSERKEDIPLLAELFLRRARPDGGALPGELLQLLSSYAWPGNARELRNVIDRFATFNRADPALLFDRPSVERPSDSGWIPKERLLRLPYHEANRELVEAYHRAILPELIEQAGSVAGAAERLELPKASLYRMLRQMKADPADE
jgi:transcriptional regulator with GAF, ATPase, and Fis domain